MHDAWDTQWYAPWAGRRGDFTVVDHHLYRTFTPADNALNGEQHAAKLRNEFEGVLAHQSAEANGQLVVAEFSATINPQSIGHMPAGEQDRQRRVFVGQEIELFNKHTTGWWFWTYKLEEPWNAGWSARNATQAEILPPFVGVRFRGSPPPGNKERMLQQAHGMSLVTHKTVMAADPSYPSCRSYESCSSPTHSTFPVVPCVFTTDKPSTAHTVLVHPRRLAKPHVICPRLRTRMGRRPVIPLPPLGTERHWLHAPMGHA